MIHGSALWPSPSQSGPQHRQGWQPCGLHPVSPVHSTSRGRSREPLPRSAALSSSTKFWYSTVSLVFLSLRIWIFKTGLQAGLWGAGLPAQPQIMFLSESGDTFLRFEKNCWTQPCWPGSAPSGFFFSNLHFNFDNNFRSSLLAIAKHFSNLPIKGA